MRHKTTRVENVDDLVIRGGDFVFINKEKIRDNYMFLDTLGEGKSGHVQDLLEKCGSVFTRRPTYSERSKSYVKTR